MHHQHIWKNAGRWIIALFIYSIILSSLKSREIFRKFLLTVISSPFIEINIVLRSCASFCSYRYFVLSSTTNFRQQTSISNWKSAIIGVCRSLRNNFLGSTWKRRHLNHVYAYWYARVTKARLRSMGTFFSSYLSRSNCPRALRHVRDSGGIVDCTTEFFLSDQTHGKPRDTRACAKSCAECK